MWDPLSFLLFDFGKWKIIIKNKKIKKMEKQRFGGSFFVFLPFLGRFVGR